ncbi:DNA topoisomerase IV subunit A [Halalkalibacterium halodurans]|uniref:DNA topoisomerase 4 subunit A n=1 Tax=Halalkalibacterium halodurans (strain ATCC BAA-125 / DSM 18197 / FERM 7344 / JCM 9153 / C-125) TaxID=272558 RepID=Q9KAZ7_HALH5|nr:DNA topoisomerase IV subunit A [Halalkalibacterium halodurans]MED4081114.1 DNA topoisomerase IV subunit A [Halalkalibacterium halodurans]MED4085721.1 DNA topoisomerase IV subunit A [Halalkalibacterium halodurans]MED4106464.1 DNA topoisomerase IV subunit A [Halalkalibacterium halodurans]MED4108238.1 DNA topoisomerase IV subunit A [Halalkalibacterium halodurans]MED4151138.1 DNA topoisomerase IV subunit A [Halalkalibacterium halodurans]
MAQTERYLDLPLEEVIGDRFGRYSKYIIQERALPDARDGLKPVQRRILYAMYRDGNTADKPFRKSAKTVGNVIGNYHPHGDSSVYDAMIRMSQEWKVRNILVDMHGNNGSIDGDPPAAMRYTEARLSKIAAELLRDIDKETVDYIPNFDDSEQEPVVLPAKFPNLLVNGSTGISSGYATDIPPHHLGEVIDGVIMQMENPNVTLDELMQVIKGPDFPTGGIVQGIEGIRQAYSTGKGKVVVRGKAEIEDLRGGKQQIVITEIPYEVVKANLVKKMDEIRFDKKVDGIAEVRDDTDRTGLRIVVELKKDADANGILQYLFKNTDLQITYNFNMVAIHNKTPRLMGLKSLIQAYIDHQKDVIIRRATYDLQKAKDRQHIVQGLMKAISILDDVIQTIRASKDKKNAKDNLIAQFDFTEAQAEAIVTLQLYRLTNTDITTLEEEAAELERRIHELEAILASEKKLIGVVKKELLAIKKQFTDERRTIIKKEIEEIKITMDVLVASEDVMVTVTKEGYVKRTSLRSYAASNGELPGMKEGDYLLGRYEMNTQDTLLLFTKKGNYLYLPVHQLPDIRWKDNGQHVANLVTVDKDDDILTTLAVKEFSEEESLLFITRQGMAKRSQLSLYKAQRFSKPLMALKLKDDDEVVSVMRTSGNEEVFIATSFGYGLWFSENEISQVGQRAAGVKGINLKNDDAVVDATTFTLNDRVEFLVVTHRGGVKRISITEFDKSTRAKRGLVMLRELKKNPHHIVACKRISDGSDTFFIKTEDGTIVTVAPSSFRRSDRYSNGSFVLDQDKTGVVTNVWKEVSLIDDKEGES